MFLLSQIAPADLFHLGLEYIGLRLFYFPLEITIFAHRDVKSSASIQEVIGDLRGEIPVSVSGGAELLQLRASALTSDIKPVTIGNSGCGGIILDIAHSH